GEARLSARRHDQWAASAIADHLGGGAPSPACVVRPRRVEDVQKLLAFAAAERIAVIPYGAGSGVVGGILASPEVIICDVGAMNKVRFIDEVNLLASFDAGCMGLAAEEAVAQRGLTIGHWPQSVAVSSVGGWIATRAIGQFSTAYGGIEEIAAEIEAVLPSGRLVRFGRGPRASAGPDLRHLMLGSEGTLGVITAATLFLRRSAQSRRLSAWRADSMEPGLTFQREIVQAGWHPPVMRQYDERESQRLERATGIPGDGCLILLVQEGPSSLVSVEAAEIGALAERLGIAPADCEIVQHWLDHRNEVPSWGALLDRGIVADTVEVSAGWRTIGQLYDEATRSLREMEGCLAASAHSSHVYRSGLNLYFTFAFTRAPQAMRSTYDEAWRRILEATLRLGGSLSHHHGIGRVRRPWLARELGETGAEVLSAIKKTLDPTGIMNPGVLIGDG
ncbi:MAG: FAD-binding oxidoreductase, partial [Caulobacteraceae bacterium]